MLDADDLVPALATLAATLIALYVAGYFATAPRAAGAGKVTSIVVYPLKSAKGVAVQSARLDARGLEYDRLWMVVDENGSFLSQRRAPKLALVEAKLPNSPDEPLQLSAPGAKPLRVPVVRTSSAAPAQVRVWDARPAAVDQGDEAGKWFEAVLGVEGARLVRMADDAQRVVDQKYAPRGATTAFSDGFPLLLANEASLSQLNEKLTARGKTTIPMDRFRPNLVIGGGAPGENGAPPFAEDAWSAISVGVRNVTFGIVKPCARCKMPTIDQATGVPDGRATACSTKGTADDDDEGGGPTAEAEPTATMRTFRTGRLLGYRKPGWADDVFFGQNLVLRAHAGAVVAVGDAVLATPKRPRGWFGRGTRGVDYF